ncbi:hypothetical protein D3C78_1696370 [compost metagenome]
MVEAIIHRQVVRLVTVEYDERALIDHSVKTPMGNSGVSSLEIDEQDKITRHLTQTAGWPCGAVRAAKQARRDEILRRHVMVGS